MRQGMILGALLAVLLAGSAWADPLTTPITQTAMTYDVEATIDFTAATVLIRVRLLDATGAVLRASNQSVSVADLGLSPVAVAAIKARIVDYLRARAVVN